ncbi:MAG: hypothetical protein JO140_00820 [Candidatus Eremiobacteraeota bacterium]|nr:hypothetical protein [Candidatus Eremiobacteraeota bacterium]
MRWRVALGDRLRKITPLGIGAFATAAGAAAIYAYDACADSAIAPGGDCNCWLSALCGLAAGLLVAALVTLARALLQPLLASVWEALALPALRGGPVAASALHPCEGFCIAIAPQARHRALRGPPTPV